MCPKLQSANMMTLQENVQTATNSDQNADRMRCACLSRETTVRIKA